jgi:hypothetical protein
MRWGKNFFESLANTIELVAVRLECREGAKEYLFFEPTKNQILPGSERHQHQRECSGRKSQKVASEAALARVQG